VPATWANTTLTFGLTTVNTTHYTFSAGPAATYPEGAVKDIAVVPAEIISWGFTGALLGVYATTNGKQEVGEGTEAYVKRWRYTGTEQQRVVPPGLIEGGW
jgi:hypothetical protein